MKRPRSSVDERRLEILKKIQAQDEIKVEQLAEEFGLSLMTVRRDLQFLESRQLIAAYLQNLGQLLLRCGLSGVLFAHVLPLAFNYSLRKLSQT